MFFVDETSLPELARWLEILPKMAKIDAWIEVQSVENEIPLPQHSDTNIHWFHRNESLDKVAYGALPLQVLASLSEDLLSKNTWIRAATEAHTIG